MDNTGFATYQIEDKSYVSFIKREIHHLVHKAGFSSKQTGEIDIIISELTSNIVKHASEGELLYRIIQENNTTAFEVYCLDNGPGTNTIDRFMQDGLSTTNTLGQGLGSIKRLSDFFQIYSRKDWGTVAYAKVLMKQPLQTTTSLKNIEVKCLQVNIPGETVCGDGYYVKKTAFETQIFLGDGLGHGPHAHEAVATAIDAFRACTESSPTEILKHIDFHTKKTRGLVGAVAVLDHKKRQWKFAGVGNIMTRLQDGISAKNCMSYNGIIGLNIPRSLQDHVTEAQKYQYIIMCSDGIKTKWNLTDYPSIFKYDPSLIAAAIYKDQARRTDDMSVLIGKINL